MAVKPNSQVFLFLSQVLGRRIVDPEGRLLGRISDLVVSIADLYPPLTAILCLSARGKAAGRLPWKEVVDFGDPVVVSSAPAPDPAEGVRRQGELLLKESLLDKQIVDLHGWLSMSEFVDVVTISQMTPGPIAINSATFVGMRIAGLLGAIVATIGCVTPSCIIVLTIAYFYYKYRNLWVIQGTLKGLRPVVVASIASAGLAILLTALYGGEAKSWFTVNLAQINLIAAALFAVGFAVLRKFKPDPIFVMVGCGLIGLFFF
jgi:chromate transporter